MSTTACSTSLTTTTNTPSYIVAASTNTTTVTSPTIEPTSINTPQALSDIKLICIQRKKVCQSLLKSHAYTNCFSSLNRKANVIFI